MRELRDLFPRRIILFLVRSSRPSHFRVNSLLSCYSYLEHEAARGRKMGSEEIDEDREKHYRSEISQQSVKLNRLEVRTIHRIN